LENRIFREISVPDSKSPDPRGRVGSSPTSGINKIKGLAHAGFPFFCADLPDYLAGELGRVYLHKKGLSQGAWDRQWVQSMVTFGPDAA
jgi:hypothetical protein